MITLFMSCNASLKVIDNVNILLLEINIHFDTNDEYFILFYRKSRLTQQLK